jgi:hypothetical protein
MVEEMSRQRLVCRKQFNGAQQQIVELATMSP